MTTNASYHTQFLTAPETLYINNILLLLPLELSISSAWRFSFFLGNSVFVGQYILLFLTVRYEDMVPISCSALASMSMYV